MCLLTSGSQCHPRLRELRIRIEAVVTQTTFDDYVAEVQTVLCEQLERFGSSTQIWAKPALL
jgi:hypothetical protein